MNSLHTCPRWFLLSLSTLLLFAVAACGDDDPNGEPSPDSITPLPKTAFVFNRYVRDTAAHLYSYDLATKKTTLISKLDDDGTIGTNPSIALSPDRRWVAFRALFRPDAKDKAEGIAIPSIWKVSVDGKHFKRLTDTIPNPNKLTCENDSQCPKPMTCILSLKRCAPAHFTVGLSTPTWSADGKTVYTSLSQTWTSGSSIAGGAVLASVPATGGTLKTHYVGSSDCVLTIYPSAHPSENSLAAVHSVGGGCVPGLYRYALPPTSKPTRIFSSATVGVQQGPITWQPDGSAAFFLGDTTWDLNNDGTPETQGWGIVGVRIKDGALSGLLGPLATGKSYFSYDISPSGNEMAVCIFDSKASTYEIYLMDAADPKKVTFKQLTSGGKSCYPSW